MFGLMFQQFLRTNTCKLGLSLILVIGVISILIGHQFLKNQKQETVHVQENQLRHIERNVALHSEDIGLLLYYLKFSLVNKTNPLAGFSIGQKDVNPSVRSVKILTLEGQRYDTDLMNPTNLLYGNLDLSFVIIYVFPLLVIAFTYNLRSEEEESGTLRMVRIMSKSMPRFLLAKLAIRAMLLFVMLLLIYLIGSLTLGIPWDELLLAFGVSSLLYLIFWFALSFWVVSLNQHSNFNALALLSVWLFLVILLPATLNNLVTNQYPIPEAFTTMIKQRDGYHQKWDTNKRETVEKFYQQYPQFAHYGFPPEDGFNWLWYYAMQHLGDEESSASSSQMHTKWMQRAEASKNWSRFIPSMHTQLAFNDIAQTGLLDHLHFLQALKDFHENKRLFFYPKIFSNVDGHEVDWEQFRPEYFQLEYKVHWSQILVPLILAILLFAGGTYLNLRKA